jgi:cytochrome P450
MAVDLSYFEEHYTLRHPDLAEHMWEVVAHMQTRCPVAHSDAPTDSGGARDGSWVITKYGDVFRVLQDWQAFSSDHRWLAKAETFNARLGYRPPISVDPPLQRDFRHLLNPFLSPQAVATHEPQVRQIVTELIDDFIEDGQCDLVSQLASLLPPRVLYRILFGVDDEDQLQLSLQYTIELSNRLRSGDPAGFATAQTAWMGWVDEFIEERRASPRRPDMIDALLYGSVEGRPLSHEEVSGTIRLLINGGFFTTSDATSFTMLMLAENPVVQDLLREHPNLIPNVLDETLRLEPPVVSLFRVCTRDVELSGRQLKQGDAVLIHFGGANRDPDQFDQASELQPERSPNRHLSFGAGPHRCIGSNMARLNLRIVFEELLFRLRDVRITANEAPRPSRPSFGRGLDYLPISFTPGPRSRPQPLTPS